MASSKTAIIKLVGQPKRPKPFSLIHTLIRPSPVSKLLRINSSLIRIILARNLLLEQLLPRRTALITQHGLQIIDRENSKRITIRLVTDQQLERRVDVALLLVSAHMHQVLTNALVGHAVHEPGVRVEVEHDGLVVGEDGGVLGCCQAVGVVAVWHELEEVDDVDEADFQLGEVLAQESGGGQGLLRWDVAAACHDEVGFGARVVGGPVPDADAFSAVGYGVFHVEELQVVLFVRYDDVDVVLAFEAVVHCREQTVAVWW